MSGPISFDQTLEGAITYPDGAGPWPLLLLLHGNHQTCILADGTFDNPPPDSPSFQLRFGVRGRRTGSIELADMALQ